MQSRLCRLSTLAALGALMPCLAADAPRPLLQPAEHTRSLKARDATAERSGDHLRIRFGTNQQWPGVTLKGPPGGWDWSAYTAITLVVKHAAGGPAHVGCRLDSPLPDGKTASAQAGADLSPGQTVTLHVSLARMPPPALAGKLFGMRGLPGGFAAKGGINPERLSEMILFVRKPRQPVTLEFAAVRPGAAADRPPADVTRLFPMIDRFGQYVHRDWPGKLRDVAELAQRRDSEDAELKKQPQPDHWNRYGGWEGGPQLEKTGFFRAEKHEGKWWLIDPEGRLFWSHGVDCVRPGAETPITDRKHWYADLPRPGEPLAAFYGKGYWAPHGYYQDRPKPFETYDFLAANLFRKYGAEGGETFADRTQRRLRAWGVNTIGNWSDPKVYRLRRTPYVTTVNADGPRLEGSSGYWGKFHDVFDPRFRAGLRKRMAGEKATSAGDPWCLGYFVDNELSWGEELSLATGALASAADQPAKRAFVEDLRTKYESIEALNRAWGTRHADWDALLKTRTLPNPAKARADLEAFATKTAEQYFRICREAVKEVAPQQLYLGCRFAWANERAVRAAAKFCDVISYNLYRDSIADFRLPAGIDRGVIVGEFHFGALDRGMFHTGLRPVATQRHRADAYRNYLHGALANPAIVGTHWFQYYDQATTGRGDGENYQIGFLDVTDTPYPETVAAVREVGHSLYALRAGKR